MEGDEHQRRRFQPSNYPRGYHTDPRVRGGGAPTAHSVRGTASGDHGRLGQAQSFITRSPASSALSAGPQGSQDMGSYGYAHGHQYPASQIQPTSFAYPSEYSQDPQRPQQFAPYSSQIVYDVPQQVEPQAPYESATQYQPRASVAVEVLSSQFGTPQQYYNTGGNPNVSGPPMMQQQFPAVPYHQPMQYPSATDIARSNLAPAYSAIDTDIPQPTAADAVGQQVEETEQNDISSTPYPTLLRETNQNVIEGRLIEAGETLLQMSELFLGRITQWGFHKDNQELYRGRLEVWKQFNNSWLAVFQGQWENTKTAEATGGVAPPGKSLLPKESVVHLADELVRLCDKIHPHGLVDYEMGVWEDEIITAIQKCKAQFSDSDEDEDDPA